MDASRFAARLRSLSATPSRRIALRTFGGLSLAGLLGWTKGEAKKKKKKKKKKTQCPPSPPCPSPPPAPPPPFCAGKDTCAIEVANCQAAGTTCFCFVREDNGQPFCGQVPTPVASCAVCTVEQVCIKAGGPFCEGAPVGCSTGCPNPL